MTKFVKFVATTEDVKAGVDVLVEDFQMTVNNFTAEGKNGLEEAVDMYVMEAINGGEKSIAVVSDDINVANAIAAVLNQAYTKEMELMKTTKTAEITVSVESTPEEKKAATIAKSSAAQKFLAKHANKVENTKEEVEMKQEEKKVAGRRRLNTGAATQEEKKAEVKETKTTTNEKVETEMNKPNRKSTSRVLKNTKPAAAEGRRRLGRSESIKNEFKKFEGPWYLNAELYPVLNRLEGILETLSDAELGIEQIVLVDPSEVSRTRNNPDITVVIQIKANGNILEFPIKNASANSSSDLASTSIGWVDTKNGLRPAFGFWRPNEINVKATCTCGKEFKGNTGNLYCTSCKKKHADAEVSVSHALDMEFDGNWVFQTVPNLVVPRETLALIMAIAQYDAGLDMWGVVAE
jgi:hypothetical protein